MTKWLDHITPAYSLNGSVAIIGSSASLLGGDAGRRIDAFDEVIRFNRAPTLGYETFVGSKCTLRVVNNHVFQNKDIRKFGYTNSPPNFVRDLRDMKILLVSPQEHIWSNREFYTDKSNDLFLFQFAQMAKLRAEFGMPTDGRAFSVGTLLVCLSIKAGIAPTLFGFDLDSQARTHYFQERPSKPNTKCHDPVGESKLLKSLIERGLIFIG
jgi:hypothetical protein